MMQNTLYHLENAKQAHASNTLLPWTISYLESEDRNKIVAFHIKRRSMVHVELVDYPLSHLKRIEGRQNGEVAIETVDHWVQRVDDIKQAIVSKKYTPEPLIVTDFWDKIEIADGNHRHEALINSGFEKYWTIFLLTKPESIKTLALTQRT